MTKPLTAEQKALNLQARRDAKAQSPTSTATAEKKKPPKAEVVKPLPVEIDFPAIMDLKQALAFDSDGNLVIGIQFKAKVDQYEIFRLINLLKQPHGTLYARIGSAQSAMDFKFDPKAGKVKVINAPKTTPQATGDETDKPQEEPAQSLFPEPTTIRFDKVAFNYIPEEKKPYGVAIDFAADGSEETHTVAGRGKTASQAVLAGVKATTAFPDDLKEPFEVKPALEAMDPSPECYKLIRVLEVGSFDEGFDTGDGGTEEENQGD